MDLVKDLKELQALLKLCRKQGITKFHAGDLQIEFGDLPVKQTTQEDEFETDDLTPEQLMFLSAHQGA